jgi:hypothetical protein
MLSTTAKDLLVDVYPQGVGSHVDIYGGNVNDREQTGFIHPGAIWLWPNTLVNPQGRSWTSLGYSWLSPESTHAMTTDEPSYLSMQNCTSTSRARSVDTVPTPSA